MPDSGAIDRGLLARLRGDAALTAILTDGIWMHEATQGKTAFGIVALVDAIDRPQQGPKGQRRALEEATYAVKAVIQGTGRTVPGQAAARIDALLEDEPFPIEGYTCLSIERVGRIDDTEVDQVDNALRWQHRGGRYRLRVAPQQGG